MTIFNFILNLSIDLLNNSIFINLFLPIFIFSFCIYVLRLWGNKF